jgi:DNA polymerase I-like protein with 3'-5' exonuclease and polymerase domains
MPSSCRLILSIHDELVASVPKKDWKKTMQLMKESMENQKFDVPMLSEGAYSDTDFAHLIDSDKKGKIV